jgi:ribA/ribD-fused uncharacterized protein
MSLLFYKEHPVLGCLSNFSPHKILFGEKVYPTSEHCFQAHKFLESDPAWTERIRRANSPSAAKYLARSRHAPIPADWSTRRLTLMLEILRAKTSQHLEIPKVLFLSGTSDLIEKSPWDSFWGNGRDGKGENWLGRLWMKVRGELQLPAGPQGIFR